MFLRGYPVAVEDWEGESFSTIQSNWVNGPAADAISVNYSTESNSGQLGGTSYYAYGFADEYQVGPNDERGSRTGHFDGFTTGNKQMNGTGTTLVEDGSFFEFSGTGTADSSQNSNHAEMVSNNIWEIGSRLHTDDSNATETTFQITFLRQTSDGTFFDFSSFTSSGVVNIQPDFNNTGPVWASGTTFESSFTVEGVSTLDTTATEEAWTSTRAPYFDGTSYHTDRMVLTITTITSSFDSWTETTYSYNDTSQGETNIYFLDPFGFYVFDSVWIPQYDRLYADWLWVGTFPEADSLIRDEPYRFTDLFFPLGEGENFTLEVNKDLSDQVRPLVDQTAFAVTNTVVIPAVGFTSGTGYDASTAGIVTFTSYLPGDFPLSSTAQGQAWLTTLTHAADSFVNSTAPAGVGTGLGVRASYLGTAQTQSFYPSVGAMFSYWPHSDGGYHTTWIDIGGILTGSIEVPVATQALLTLGTDGAFSMGGLTFRGIDPPDLAVRYFDALGEDGSPWAVYSVYPDYKMGYQLPPFVSPEDPIYAGLEAGFSMPFPGGLTTDYPLGTTGWTRDVVGGPGQGPQQGPGVFNPYRFFYNDGTDTSGMISASDTNSVTYVYSWGTNSIDSNLWELSVTSRLTFHAGSTTRSITGSFINPITPFGDLRSTFLSVDAATHALGQSGIFQLGGKHPRAGSNYRNSIFLYGVFQTTNSNKESGYETFCRSNDNTYFEEDDVSAFRNIHSLDIMRISHGGNYSASAYPLILHPPNPE